jgi:hypothetical protein
MSVYLQPYKYLRPGFFEGETTGKYAIKSVVKHIET